MSKQEMVYDRVAGQLRPVASAPVLSSAHLDWRGVLLEQHWIPSLGPSSVMWINHVVFVQLKQAITLESKLGSETVTRRILPGQISILPAQTVTMSQCSDPVEFLMVSLEPAFMKVACSELSGAD